MRIRNHIQQSKMNKIGLPRMFLKNITLDLSGHRICVFTQTCFKVRDVLGLNTSQNEIVVKVDEKRV